MSYDKLRGCHFDMLTSHKLLQQYWHDDRYDIGKVRIWYVDRGAPNDRSTINGYDLSLEPYYLSIRTMDGEKPVPYHRILLITYDGEVTFENQKIQGLAYQLIEESQNTR
ncbi:DUF504 domain-containing protein [Candidatus Bathyarchaeota archaeon]|nr:DUF504 domain-containing protein [Candidatus Bathyarchaeota archaeon]